MTVCSNEGLLPNKALVVSPFKMCSSFVITGLLYAPIIHLSLLSTIPSSSPITPPSSPSSLPMDHSSWTKSPAMTPFESDEPSSQQSLSQGKKPRHRHSPIQLEALNALYTQNDHPPLEDRVSLAEKIGMPTKTVNAWFQNKRASTKKRNTASTQKPPAEGKTLPSISALLSSSSSLSSHQSSSHHHHHSHHVAKYEYMDEEEYLHPVPPRTSSHPSLAMMPTANAKSIAAVTPPPPPAATMAVFAHDQERHQQQQQQQQHSQQSHFFSETSTTLRPTRVRPTASQTEQLRRLYNSNPHPSKEEREELGDRIGMRYQSITNWFQNQRSISRKKREHDLGDADISSNGTTGGGGGSSLDVRPYSAQPPASSHPSLPPQLPPLQTTTAALGTIVPILSHRSRTEPGPLSSIIGHSAPGSPRRANLTRRSSTPYSVVGSAGRPRRTRPEPYQLDALKKMFRRTANPTIEERSALAIQIGMDVGKVTNWFRNLRQTARKRAKRVSSAGFDDDETSVHGGGMGGGRGSTSRSGTPSVFSSSSSVYTDDQLDMDMDAASDLLSEDDEDYRQEAVTPSPESSPPPYTNARHSLHQHGLHVPDKYKPDARSSVFNMVLAAEIIEKKPIKTPSEDVGARSAPRVEDALLLLSFHQAVMPS